MDNFVVFSGFSWLCTTEQLVTRERSWLRQVGWQWRRRTIEIKYGERRVSVCSGILTAHERSRPLERI